MNDASSDRDPFEVLAESFLARYRAGERPSIEDLAARHPELAGPIRKLLPALVRVERDLSVAPDADPGSKSGRPPLGPVTGKERRLGDYRILREVGRGGMGVVYEAEQVSLGRRVALKVLPGHVAGDRVALERFRREAKAAARLHHTNIVPVFEVGRDGEVAYFAMQFIRGQGLDQVIDELVRLRGLVRRPGGTDVPSAEAVGTPPGRRKHTLGRVAESVLSGRFATEGAIPSRELSPDPANGPPATEQLARDASVGGDFIHENPELARPGPTAASAHSAVLPGGSQVSTVPLSGRRVPFFRSVAQIGRQAAQGLAYAHASGLVHRDIKPSNLLLDHAGVVWIADFGLAKAGDDGLTETGDVLGTLRYMAPERFRGEGDARADIYALGLTLYELLTLRPAYDSSDRLKLIERIKAEEPPRPRSIDGRVPRDLETIVLKAIEKEPGSRYPSADAMAEDLRRYLADEPIKARQIGVSERYWRWARRNPVVALLGGVLAAILVTVTIGSLLAAARFASLADNARNLATAERGARLDADQARRHADQARKAAETARAASQAETYRAMLSEVRALRAGHQLGWRAEALENLSRMSVMPTPRRDLAELRTEAMASLGEFDLVEVARLEGFRSAVWSLAFSPDSRALAVATTIGDLDLYDVSRPRHSWQITDPEGKLRPWGWPAAADPNCLVRFLRDGSLARTTWRHRVEFLNASGQPSTRPSIVGGEAQAVSLEVDGQGRWLAIGWNDGRVDLHDAATGALRRSVKGNPACIALSPDGKWLALTGPDNTISILTTDQATPPITVGQQHAAVASLAFSPDGKTLASTSWDKTATLWDVTRRDEGVVLRGHKERVTDVAFSPDGNWVATTSQDYTARIWDPRTGQTLAVLPGTWFVKTVAFSPDGLYLAVAVQNGDVGLYQIRGRRERRWLAGHANGVNTLAFHPTRPLLASAADDHHVIVWDPESARPLHRWRHDGGVDGLAFSPDGSLLACGGGRGGGKSGPGEIQLWNTETDSLVRALPGDAMGVHALAFDDTGRRLATGDTGGVLVIWDVATGQILRRENVGPSWMWSIAFLDEGRRLVTAVSDGPIVIYDLEGTEPPRRFAVLGGLRRFVVDRARNDVIVAGNAGTLTRVSLRDFTVSHQVDEGPHGKIESIALAPGGRLLATGGATDGRIILRDATTFASLATLPTWSGMVKDLAFDSSGRWLAIAGADSDIGLWDLRMVHDELATPGLAWDQAPPSVSSTAIVAREGGRPRPPVPIIKPEDNDPADLEKARGLLNSGVAALDRGRFEAAAVHLEQASERLQVLRKARPSDPLLAGLHGISLGSLASVLRDLERSGEALARARESLAVYESLNTPRAIDHHNMSRASAFMSSLEDRGSAADRESLRARAVDYLRTAIEQDAEQILPLVASDRDFDPLRDRDDFKVMIADAAFPRDPFVQPSPLSPSLATPEQRRAKGETLLAGGRTIEAIPLLASSWSENTPEPDILLLLKVAALQAWFGQDAELAVTCRRALEIARDAPEPATAERTAKICSLRPSDDKARRDASLALARRAVAIGKDHPYMPYFRMALGMAEYRSGNDTAAEEALLAAEKMGEFHPHISGTSAFYRAMSLFRRGKAAEARKLALEAISTMKPLPADQNNPLTDGANADDLILWMACKEARALLGLDAPSPHEGKA